MNAMLRLPAVLFTGLCALSVESLAAPERPDEDLWTALGLARPAASRGNTAVAALLDSAERELEAERPERASSLLERALRIEPQNPTVWHYLGVTRLAQGNHAQAEAMAAKSASLAAGDRTLRSRNAGLTAAALRAAGKTVEPPSDVESFASRSSASAESASPRYAPVSRRERSVNTVAAPQPASTWTERGAAAAERAPRQGECLVWFYDERGRRQTATMSCASLRAYVSRSAGSVSREQPSASRAERRAPTRYRSNEPVRLELAL